MSEQFLQELTELSEIDQVKELASLFISPRDIAAFVGFSEEEFLMKLKFEPEDDFVKAYRRGVSETKIKLRFDTKRFALSGSPEAANAMKDYLSQQEISEIQ